MPLYVMKIFSSLGLLSSLGLGLMSTSIFTIWVFLELNLMSFVLFISLHQYKYTLNVMVQYFLVQALGSLLLISISLSVELGAITSSYEIAVVIPLLIKLGMPPLHAWYVSFISESSWLILFLSSSLQKVLPFYIWAQIWNSVNSLILFMIVVSSLGALSQNWFKKFLAYSSMFTGCWMLAMGASFSFGVLYLLFYSVGLWVLLDQIKEMKYFSLKLSLFNGFYTFSYVVISVALLSLAGLPPFLGFVGKVILLTQLMAKDVLLFISLLLSSVLLLAIYLQIFITSSLTPSMNFFSTKENLQKNIFYMLSLSFLPLFILILHMGV